MAIKNFVDAYGNSIEEELCAEPTSHGLMCPEDKLKLEGIEDGANKYVHPTHTAYASGLYKITTNELGHVIEVTPVVKKDITDLGIPESDTDTTYSTVTDKEDGLMSKEDKVKLDAIPENANNFTYTHPSYNSAESGLYKIKVEGGHVAEVTPVTSADINSLGIEGVKYSLSKDGNKIVLKGSDNSQTEVTDSDTTYTHPTHTAYASGLYKITTNELGHVTSAVPVTKSDITAYGISDNQHTHSQYVDIASEQTITGVKTFKDSYILGRSVFTWDSELNAVVISFEN